MNLKNGMKRLIITAAILVVGLVSANSVLAETIDLQGYEARITTQGDQNYITNKKGSWLLTKDTMLFSKKWQVIKLDNTLPAEVNSVYMQNNLEIKGKGELNAVTDGMFGINVFGNFYAFTNTCYGAGKISATGNVDGVHVYGTLKLYSGVIEGNGNEHGVWSNSNTYIYKNGTLNGIATSTNPNGIGVWSNKEITACSYSTIHGTGEASGVYMNGSGCKYIYSDISSNIIGTTGNINNPLSAVHANNGKVKACSKGTITEEYDYNKSNLDWVSDSPVNLNQYTAINNNMTSFKNYQWTIDEGSVVVDSTGLVFSEDSNGTLIGSRTDYNCKLKEKVYTPCKANHVVKIFNVYTGDGLGRIKK